MTATNKGGTLTARAELSLVTRAQDGSETELYRHPDLIEIPANGSKDISIPRPDDVDSKLWSEGKVLVRFKEKTPLNPQAAQTVQKVEVGIWFG